MSNKDEKNKTKTVKQQAHNQNIHKKWPKKETPTILISCPLWFEQHLKFQTGGYIYEFDFVVVNSSHEIGNLI